MLVLIAPDKFKSTLSSAQVANAMARGIKSLGMNFVQMPLADGGEGTVDILGGVNRETIVTGPLGEEVLAGWHLDGHSAVIEMASASGLTLAGGSQKNDPINATSSGTGQLILAAMNAGARRIIVGAGGSACTDGGRGALEILKDYGRLDGSQGVELIIAADVQTPFLEAATIFGRQKGATPNQIDRLTRFLRLLARQYQQEFNIDVTKIRGSGAAGGFAGGMAVLGAKIENGFELVAREIGFEKALANSDFVLTGEGLLDSTSFEGKVVGSVITKAKEAKVPVGVIAGRIAERINRDFPSMSLVEEFGGVRAMTAAAESIEDATRQVIQQFRASLIDNR